MKIKLAIGSAVLAVMLITEQAAAASALMVQKTTNCLNGPMLNYECSYPRLSGLKNRDTEQKLNVFFKEKAEASAKTAEYASRKLAGTNTQVNGKFDYTVKRNENGILSIVTTERLSVGGERGINSQAAYNIDTVSGNILKLKDFFIDGADYRSVLSESVSTQIKRRGLNVKLLQNFREIKRDEEFYLTGDSIVIFFQQYEYFPYECGIQEFSIPLKALDGMLKPEYRLCT